jgi:hypothetical protein
VTNSHGIDAIHAKGMVALPTGGMIILAAKEVVGQGFNGIAGMSIPQYGTTVDSFYSPA